KALNVPDYGRWRSIGSATISDDGVFATWSYTQRNVDDTLYVHNLNTDADTKIPRGSGPQFSDDSKWIVYTVAPPGANGRGGRGGRGGGAGGANAGGEQSDANSRRTELRNLATGAVTTFENVQSVTFNKGSTVLLVRKNRPAGAAAPAAADANAGGGGGGRG